MTALAVLASSPVVGSSRNKMPGLMMSSIPIFVRFRSPPDTPRINCVPTYRVAQQTLTNLSILFATAKGGNN